MSIAEAIADIALGFSSVLGAGYHDAVAKWPGEPVLDDGGSIITPAVPVEKPCSVQIDAATEAMRAAEGFVDGDVRLLVLAATLDGDMDASATVEVLAGPHAGEWMIASVTRDPAGVYWECQGRRA